MPKGRGKVLRGVRMVDWTALRKRWENEGPTTFSSLAREGLASRQAITKKAKEQGWVKFDPTTPEARRAIAQQADSNATEQVVGEVMPPDQPPAPPGQPTGQALINHEGVTARASVIDRHRKEINLARNRIYAALQQPNSETFQKLKEGKIAAEAFSIIHADERKSWGLDGDPPIVVQFIPPSQRDLIE